MNRSAVSAVKNDPALLPGPGDDGDAIGRAVMILGEEDGVSVELRIQAMTMDDAAHFGVGGVYLQVSGARGETLAGAIAMAAKARDKDLCIYLTPVARANLMEQLRRFETILSLHTVIAQQGIAMTEEQRALRELATRAPRSAAPGRRSRAILRTVGS